MISWCCFFDMKDAWCYLTWRMFIIMVTFKILVRYFICVATAKTLSVSWHWKPFSTWTPACVADSWVVCYFTVTAAGVFVWSRRTYIAGCNFRLQIVWLQFMYIWNTVVIAFRGRKLFTWRHFVDKIIYKTVVSEIVFARKLRHAYF